MISSVVRRGEARRRGEAQRRRRAGEVRVRAAALAPIGCAHTAASQWGGVTLFSGGGRGPMRREELARVGDRMNVCGMCVYGVIGIDVCARCGCGFVVDILWLCGHVNPRRARSSRHGRAQEKPKSRLSRQKNIEPLAPNNPARDNGGNVQTGQQPVGRTRAATAAQAGGSGDSGQRAKWVRLMMLLRLRERFRCWASFRVVLTKRNRRNVQSIQEEEKEEERRQ